MTYADEKEFLSHYEKKLDPLQPEQCPIPTKVLGYGEMSTVLEIKHPDGKRYAYKRMPMFYSNDEVQQYELVLQEWIKVATSRIGIDVLNSEMFHIIDENNGRHIVYIRQKSLPSQSIGNHIIRSCKVEQASKIFTATFNEIFQVFDFNKEHAGEIEIGFDAQISNWAIEEKSASGFHLSYFDISSPLLRLNGNEQLDSELFLRSAPSFLVWIIRLLFVQDLLMRYYDERQVVIDMLANLYKEQRVDLIPSLLDVANEFIESRNLQSITLKDVRSYYREDAWIWRIYLAFRKMDRCLHRVLRRYYPYILPGKIKR